MTDITTKNRLKRPSDFKKLMSGYLQWLGVFILNSLTYKKPI